MQINKMQMQRAILPCLCPPECPECRGFNRFRLPGILICFVWFTQLLPAQTEEIPFQNGEELNYDIHYKYGLVMLKAGTGNYRINTTDYNEAVAYKSSLYFRTTSFFDKIYKIRDTLNSYSSAPDLVPLFHNRSVNEGNTHFKEELIIKKYTSDYSEVSIKRKSNNEIRFDTTFIVDNLGIDILNIFLFVRAQDYSKIKTGDSFSFSTFVGKRKNNIIIRYAGQTVLERGRNKKYKALKLNIDIAAGIFDAYKNSMEVWISDDENKIPIKMKAKLKIGAAEADLSSYKNLKKPFAAEIQIPRRK
jgi:hypothetical protein